jgi:hypothetical protein
VHNDLSIEVGDAVELFRKTLEVARILLVVDEALPIDTHDLNALRAMNETKQAPDNSDRR